MKRCSICHASYPSAFTHCPHDGSRLVEGSDWTEGAVIRGKYRVLGKLGQGGMATVYKALHMGFDELCALKVIHAELASDASFVKRFSQEAALTRKLQHPNAVKVQDIDQADDNRPFIVMEFIEGESLKEVIQHQAPLAVARVCRIAKQVAAALEAAHQIGIIHRDIKPGNILLAKPSGAAESEEGAKVLDFGIARIKEMGGVASGETLTRTGTSIGTPAYMSPEQAKGITGAGLDGRTDLYSLGVVMYEMLTGELPIKAESEVQMLIGQLNAIPQPIQERRPGLPRGLSALVMQCLAKDPALRPVSAAALIAQIEAVEPNAARDVEPDEVPTVATPRPRVESEPKTGPQPRKRRPAVVVLAVLFCALAISNFARHFRSGLRPASHAPLAAEPSVAQSTRPPESALVSNEPASPPTPLVVPPTGKQATPTLAPKSTTEDTAAIPEDLDRALGSLPVDAATARKIKELSREADELSKKGDLEGAMALYRKLTELHPGWAPAMGALNALAALGLAAQKETGSRASAALVRHYSLEVARHPGEAGSHYKLGTALGNNGDLDGDKREQQAALRLDPSLAGAHAELASVFARQEQWVDSAREYREAIRLKPNLPNAHTGLGEALGRQGDWQGEIDEERAALQRQPGLAIAHFRLAVALEKQGETAEALQEYKRATQLDPANTGFRSNYQRLSLGN